MSELNARIGRTMQGPFMRVLVPLHEAPHPSPLPITGERETARRSLRPRPGNGERAGFREWSRRLVRDLPAVWLLLAALLLALPIVAPLQFCFGHPLRLATAHAAAPLLALAGFEVVARGAAFEYAGRTILVDPTCAGIGMLWVGSFTAALLSYLTGASARRALANGLFAAAAVFAANVLRNALLFFPESGLLRAPAWAHDAIGLAAFAAAIAPVVAFVHARRA